MVNVETVRYYERRQLIPSPPRGPSGYRQFAPDVVRRIRFIKRAQHLVFTLNEIKKLLTLADGDDVACDSVRNFALAKITEMDAKINHLQKLRVVLADLAAACKERHPLGECPIIDALSEETEHES